MNIIAGTPTPGTWYYFAVTWDEGRSLNEVNWHIGPVGGTLSSGVLDINDAAMVGNGGAVTFGNKDAASGSAWRQPSNPGTLDEIAVFI